jgi:MFS family permease
MLLFGRMSDKFGRRWFVIGASTMGFVGGIIACRARNMNTLVGANVRLSTSLWGWNE